MIFFRNGRAARTALMAATAPLAAGSFAQADEAAVMVTATRQPARINELLADVTVIDREAIEQAGPTTLPELLARQPGLHVIDNGGPGKSASLFIRGTSATHALLLVDGVPLGSATTGSPSLHNLPLSQIERIEILRGTASSLYGSDAIGGVVQVFTRRGDGPPRFTAHAGAGTHGTTEAGAGVSGSDGRLSYSLSAADYRTKGFNVAADASRYRTANSTVPSDDADGYRNRAVTGRLAWALTDDHELGVNLLEATSRNAYDSGGATVDAYSNDRTRVAGLALRSRLAEHWTSTLRWGQSEDDSTGFAPARSQFATTQRQLTWQHDVRLPVGTVLLAAENLEQAVTSTTNYALTRRTVRALVAGYQGHWQSHSWQTSLRRDDNSQFGGRTTGTLAYGYRFAPDWQWRIATGTAFKAPTFNQLYFPNFGTAGLAPEEARNRETGLNWERGSRRLGLTWFDNRIRNLIATVSNRATNIGRARITGTSLTASATAGSWMLDAGLDLMRPVDETNGNRLPRRPAQLLKLAATRATADWKLGGELVAVGRRYDTTTQTRAMGGYAVLNLTAARLLSRDWAVEARLNNLAERVYENAWAYAVPGRVLFVGLRYTSH